MKNIQHPEAKRSFLVEKFKKNKKVMLYLSTLQDPPDVSNSDSQRNVVLELAPKSVSNFVPVQRTPKSLPAANNIQ